MNSFVKLLKLFLAFFVFLNLASCEKAADTIKIGFIDPLSGPFANVGQHFQQELELVVERVNQRGGVLGGQKLEVLALDGKGKPEDSLIAFQQMVDQGVSFLLQGNSSAVAGALTDKVKKHNARNPESPVIYLNYAAVDPVLTNEKCNFWHFRFDPDVDMKMQALTNFMAAQNNIRKVYLINQDYSFGHAVSKAAKQMLKAKRPDVEIVGDDLHPLGKVKDFMPYIAKIKASGADTVLTGNWGPDASLLIKAGDEAGLDVDFYTYYAGFVGGPASIGEAGIGRLKQVTGFHSNVGLGADELVDAYRSRYPDSKDDLYFVSLLYAVEMLVQAIENTQSLDPLVVAKALEGSKFNGPVGEVWIREDNHQLLQPVYISTLSRAGDQGVKYDVERTGMGFKTDGRVEAIDTVLPTTCEMQRPDKI